jgi:hypothetical protein
MADRHLIFDQIYVHGQFTKEGQLNYSFFDDTDIVDQERVTDSSEQEIIKWIFDNPQTYSHFMRSVIWKGREISYKLEVRQPVLEYSQRPGDIDILMWPTNEPHLAVAIECKRAKVTYDHTGKEKVNRLNYINKGIKQANQLREHGFHKTYILICIVTDGQHKDIPNSFFRYGNSNELKEAIYSIPWNEELHSDVGVIYVQLTQPTGRSHNSMYGFGICIDKQAKELDQPVNLTNRIKSFNT